MSAIFNRQKRTIASRVITIGCLLFLSGLADAQSFGDDRPMPAADDVVLRDPDDGRVEAVAVSPDGSLVATTVYGWAEGAPVACVRLWSIAERRVRNSWTLAEVHLPDCGEGTWLLRAIFPELWQLAFSPDGRLLAAGAVGCDVVTLWEVASGKERLRLAQDDLAPGRDRLARFRRFWFSPDSRSLTVNLREVGETADRPDEGDDAVVEEFVTADTASARVRSRRVIPVTDAYATLLRPDGQAVAVVSLDAQTVRLWDIAADRPQLLKREPFQPSAPADDEWGLAPLLTCSPDGSAAAYAGRVRRWFEPGSKSVMLEGIDPRACGPLTFSADSRAVCAVESVGLSALFPRALKERLGRFVGVLDRATVDILATWDATTGRRLGSVCLPRDAFCTIALLPGHRRVAVLDRTDVILRSFPAGSRKREHSE